MEAPLLVNERVQAADALEVPVARPEDSVEDVRRRLAGSRFDSVAAVVVVSGGGQVVGVVRLEDLFAAEPEPRIRALMDAQPPLVHPGDDEVVFAWEAVRRAESCLVMVDDDDRLVGLVTPQQLMRSLLSEHEQDLSRLGGVLHDAEAARATSYERVTRRLWHRLPWLLVGLAGALLAAGIVGGFEARLEGNLTLAFFVPAVVYMADAVGTQTETLVVRGLSVGVPIRPIVRRELATGLAMGVLLGGLAYPVVAVVWGDPVVASTVALALLAACSTATIVAIALPGLLRRTGADPAFGSGPLATVVQDLLSIVIYFAVASALGA